MTVGNQQVRVDNMLLLVKVNKQKFGEDGKTFAMSNEAGRNVIQPWEATSGSA